MSLAKTGYAYQRGLADLGRGSYAWMQPNGSWGWSNAGLITDGDQSLLVDTLFDLKLTREMLATMRDAARPIANDEGKCSGSSECCFPFDSSLRIRGLGRAVGIDLAE